MSTYPPDPAPPPYPAGTPQPAYPFARRTSSEEGQLGFICRRRLLTPRDSRACNLHDRHALVCAFTEEQSRPPGSQAIELSNPNLEVLNIDTSRGVMKVYDKQQKKTLTIDMEQAKQGRIKIIGDDGENISVNGDKGKVEVNEREGRDCTHGR